MSHELAEEMDADKGPFRQSSILRKKHPNIFKSWIILMEVPALFVLLFSYLIWVSWDIQPTVDTVVINEGETSMQLAVQWAQLIGTGALVATLIVVIIYTAKTSAMANATKALANAEQKNIELRERPIARFVVGCRFLVEVGAEKTGDRHMAEVQKFDFPTLIANDGAVHAKVRVRATALHKGRFIEFSEGDLYHGERIMEMQAGTGINGHLSLGNWLIENGIEVKKLQELGDSVVHYKARELLVRLESRVIYYYNPDSDFEADQSKNPPAYYRWKGEFAIDALGIWIPEYDINDFASLPKMT